ncbi:CPBP family intramembrane metalloprotease [Roseiconus nitratireducens]|uniref:CPBP family intramembrane metalloprotease n=1 Tax=Roseiconus nitratireducens TaxID=2605748 RepID=A0A5M6DHD1_9BACT|nr:CPBP family intramembrane glutamic endopeptidase [Roseiconus nitratireducens]KAA5546957.1 CPBP family intramembrane metalloprotease [Roseiconus nitratireducens]
MSRILPESADGSNWMPRGLRKRQPPLRRLPPCQSRGLFLNDEFDTTEEHPPDLVFLWACGFSLAVGLVGLVLGWLTGIDARAYLLRVQQVTAGAVLRDLGLGVAAAVPMTIAVWLLMKVPHEAIDAIKRLGDQPMMHALLSLRRPELLTISLCAGVGEELAFRGWMLPMLASLGETATGVVNTYSVGDPFTQAPPVVLAAAVFISSVAFGALHPITKLYVVVASLMGVYFAVLLITTNSLLVPIIAHASYDAAQFLIASAEERRQSESGA